MNITFNCKQCSRVVEFPMPDDLRGFMSRKYCNECKNKSHKDLIDK